MGADVEAGQSDQQQHDGSGSLRAALEPSALRAALRPTRPVFGNPWDSEGDMFMVYLAVAVVDPLLLWLGGKLMGSIFGFSSEWKLLPFMAAALVGAAGFMTIVGRERTSLAADLVAIAIWIVLGLIVAPIIGLAPPAGVAIAIYALLLLGILGYVVGLGRWKVAFLSTISWPTVWSMLALLFAFSAERLLIR
jgi:hypothetical protein